MAELVHIDLGRRGYAETLAIQERLVAEVAAASDDAAYLLLVEHDPPVITLGRTAAIEHIRVSRECLAAAGVEVHETSRGGDVTWHGPGQLVGYPIIRLGSRGRDVRGHLRNIEELIIRALAAFGVSAGRREGLTGVWVADAKVAAIGVAVRRWVSYHGFALNVASDLSGFDAIVPCGIRGCRVTSVSRLIGREVGLGEVKPVVIQCAAEVFGFAATKEGRLG